MSLIIKRQGVGGKGSPLTSSEVDANVNNLNNDKVETANSTFTGTPSLVDNLIPLTGTVLPAIYPTLNLDFANSQTLDPRVTFARSSTATYTDKTGLVKLANPNIPRFDFDPINRKCLGLLIEEGRTNLLVNSTIDGANLATQNITTTAAARTLSFYGSGSVALSGRVNMLTKTEDLNNVAWEKPDGALTITGGVSDPLGGSTAFTLTTSAVNQRFSQLNGLSNISASVWIRRRTGSGAIGLFNGAAWSALAITSEWKLFSVAGGSLFSLYLSASGDAFDVWHPDVRPTNTTNFLPAYQRVNTTTDFTPATATIVGLGAYPTRTTYTYTPTAGTLTVTVSGTVQYANDEAGKFATSFMPTGGSSFSRVADSASMTGVNFSSWFNQAEGSFYIDEDLLAPTNQVDGYSIRVAGASKPYVVGYRNSLTATKAAFVGYSGGTTQIIVGNPMKIAMYYSLVSGFYNGIINATISNADIAIGDFSGIQSTMIIGSYGGGSAGNLNGHIKKLTYYPKALSSSELVGLTR